VARLDQQPRHEAAANVTRWPRILHVVLGLDPGGTERLVVELVRRLGGDLPAAVCCLDDAGRWGAALVADGVPVTALRRRPGFRPALGRAVARAARRHGATIIHCHQYSPFVYGCLARMWRPGLRLVFTEHGRLSDGPPSAKRRCANRLLARLPHEVYAVSDDLRRHMIREGFDGSAVGVIYNGIDAGPPPDPALRACQRQRLQVSDATIVVGTIARLDPVKDLGTVLVAMSALARERPVVLLVVGDGPERARLEHQAAEAGLSDGVRFLGHRDDARQWLAACDVYVNSSVSEGVSLTILEAMAAGLPVVATRVGGTPEIVDDACGRLVPPRDPAALAAAVRALSLDCAARRALGLAARRRVAERFTVDRMVQAYREVYRRVS
jgi:glycosyltransferase involved in cell wall biosynthesis